MFKQVILMGTISLSILTLSGCASYDVRNFSPDLVTTHQVAMKIHRKVAVGDFTMRGGKDSNQILCRLAGNVYLPNKMTYTQYIKHAFQSELIASNLYVDNSHAAKHILSSEITNVVFDSLAGKWIIAGNINVDKQNVASITSTTHFGTSYDANSACKNVAEGFETATQQFVTKVLSNPTIVKQLNK